MKICTSKTPVNVVLLAMVLAAGSSVTLPVLAQDTRGTQAAASLQRVEALEVRWPGGDTERFGGARLDSTMTLVEGSGEVELASAR